MIYVYSHIKSNGARDLVEGLGATRLRNFDGMDFYRKGKKIQINEGDVIICWGNRVPDMDGVRILNAGETVGNNKYKDAVALSEAGLPTVSITTNPARSGNSGWLPRTNHHVGGNDLLNPPTRPDFFSQKVNFVNEYRLHSFLGKSIRAGKKILREGFKMATPEAPFKSAPDIAHPWIRSYDAGWRIFYDNFRSTKPMKNIANKAVKALGLDFGAVDIGETDSGVFLILEVNRAPGLEGGTTEAYIRNIQRWIDLKPEEIDNEGEEKIPGINEGNGISDLQVEPLTFSGAAASTPATFSYDVETPLDRTARLGRSPATIEEMERYLRDISRPTPIRTPTRTATVTRPSNPRPLEGNWDFTTTPPTRRAR